MQTNPEQWAQQLADDWDIECMHCSEYDGNWPHDFALAIQAAFAEREARLVGALRNIVRDAGLQRTGSLYTDDHTGWESCADDMADHAIAALKDRTHG